MKSINKYHLRILKKIITSNQQISKFCPEFQSIPYSLFLKTCVRFWPEKQYKIDHISTVNYLIN